MAIQILTFFLQPMETVEYIDKDPSDIGNNNSRVFEEIKSNVSSQIFNQDSSIRFDQASTPGVFLNLGRSNHSRTNTSHSMMRVASSNFNDSSLNTFGTPHAHLNQANHPYKNN